jgi:membrane protein YqaA with SNARE-associated domain
MRFLLKNGLKGILWLIVFLTAYYFFKEFVISKTPDAWIEKVYAQPFLVYVVYSLSEFFFGIIPPELFMIWAINKEGSAVYFMHLGLLAGISYAMGYITFLIGRNFYKHEFFNRFRNAFLKEQWPHLKRYGLFLIIVAALTPVPWAATCLLVGSSGYQSKRFLKYALARFVRFAVYGYIIFQTHLL